MDELRRVMTSLTQWGESEMDALMRCLDANSDGKVTLDELIAAVRKTDEVVQKLVSLSRNNWHDKPRAQRGEWKQRLDDAAAAVTPQKREESIDNAVLRGAVGKKTDARGELLRPVRRSVRFLLSSTFTDTNEERNYLLADVLPYLQEYGRILGELEVQALEMRWGIRAEAADNHETSEICMAELERCTQGSLGTSYVFLGMQKYGFRPFPNKIPKEYFEQLMENVASEEDREVLEEWFQLDENEVAPEQEHEREEWEASAEFQGPLGPCYVLKSKAGCKEWWPKFEAMQKALREAAGLLWPEETSEEAIKDPKERYFYERFFMSVTDEEFTRGLLRLSEESLKKKRALVIKRRLEGLEEATDVGKEVPEGQRKGEFIDVLDKTSQVDADAQRLLQAQIDMVPEELVVFDRTLKWGPGINLGNWEHVRYLQDMADCLCGELADSLLEGAREVSVAPDAVVEEAGRHLRFALERADKFCETESTRRVTDGIEEYLRGGDGQGGEGGCTALVVWGKSGAGKTYLMSKKVSDVIERTAAASTLQREGSEGGVVVVRFLGTTPASSNVRDLLESVCSQLSRAYGRSIETIPREFKELVKMFREAVVEWPSEEKPLTLVLDSVDQLNDSNGGRKLEWLPAKELSKHTKLVISTLPDYEGEFQCMSLLEERLGSERMLKVETISDHEQVLKHLLKRLGRRVTEEQMEAVSAAFTMRSEEDAAGTPLWLTIVAQVTTQCSTCSLCQHLWAEPFPAELDHL